MILTKNSYRKLPHSFFDLNKALSADDLKDKIKPHKYTIYFYTKEKKAISKIQIEVKENGDLLLNDQFHGRIWL